MYESREQHHRIYTGPPKGPPESPSKEVFMSSSHPHVPMTSPLSGIHVDAARFYGSQQERGLSTATMTSGVLTLSHSSTTIMASHEGVIYGSPISISRQNSIQPGSLAGHSSRGAPRSPLRKIDDYFPAKPWPREKQQVWVLMGEGKWRRGRPGTKLKFSLPREFDRWRLSVSVSSSLYLLFCLCICSSRKPYYRAIRRPSTPPVYL
jgi:hypothetical protein